MKVNNLHIYNQVRAVPQEALKPITGGRLKGKTDINPMWRIKALTEQFGMCGIGWKYVIAKQWLENGGNGEISAFVNVELYVKVDGAWSEPIPGTGGSAFVAKESGGLYTSDECFKMALTDAISVSCKALGFGADVYWSADSTKYNKAPQNNPLSGIPAVDTSHIDIPPGTKLIENKPTSSQSNSAGSSLGTIVCQNENCHAPITEKIFNFSADEFGVGYCIPCQKKARVAMKKAQSAR